MSDFTDRVTQSLNEFTNSQKIIANYMMENLNMIAFYTLENLAEEIGVSTTTIIRFARTLGYEGYTQMQRDVQSDIKNKVSLPERFQDVSEIPDNQLLKNSATNDIKNIQKTFSELSEDTLKNAVDLLATANNVYIMGLRSSFSLAHYMFSRISQIRDNVHLMQGVGHMYPEEMTSLKEGDVCIVYLFPRYTKITATLTAWLRKNGVKIILFTSKYNTSINGYGDVLFPCSVTGVSFKNSFAAPLCLTNYIAAALASTDYEKTKHMLQKTEEMLEKGFYLGL